MRTLNSILIAALLGASATAFAAEPATRDARMAEAMKGYQAQKAGAPAPAAAAPAAQKQTVARKHAAKKVHAKKHGAKKQHARAGKAKAPAVQATPAPVK